MKYVLLDYIKLAHFDILSYKKGICLKLFYITHGGQFENKQGWNTFSFAPYQKAYESR